LLATTIRRDDVVDERRRLELADAAKRTFGDDAGVTLMELLPPVGWADVATKQDLAVLGRDIDRLDGNFQQLRGEFAELRSDFRELRGDFAELHNEFSDLRSDFTGLQVQVERQFREMFVAMMQLTIGGFLVAIVAIVASALIS
jgi:hypothetical protein